MSLEAELVSFRIPHHNVVLPAPVVSLDGGRPEANGSLHGLGHLLDPFLQWDLPPPTDVDVEVHPVLHDLGFRYALEVDARTVTVRVDDRVGRVPVLFW